MQMNFVENPINNNIKSDRKIPSKSHKTVLL